MVTKIFLGYNRRMKYYDYETFKTDAKNLIEQCREYKADVIVGIARGGVTLAQMLAYGLDVRYLQTLQTELYDGQRKRAEIKIIESLNLQDGMKVLIVDDIVDSGETLFEILNHLHNRYPHNEFKTATIFYKPTAKVEADFRVKEATEWIEFFWESDF